MSVGKICTRIVATASPKESVRAAAARMAEHDVGTLVVEERDGSTRPLGVVTDRDIVMRCVANGLDPDDTELAAVMTTPVHLVDEATPIEEALLRMAHSGVRRLVVTSEGSQLVGILSLDDVLEMLTGEMSSIGRLLQHQGPVMTA